MNEAVKHVPSVQAWSWGFDPFQKVLVHFCDFSSFSLIQYELM